MSRQSTGVVCAVVVVAAIALAVWSQHQGTDTSSVPTADGPQDAARLTRAMTFAGPKEPTK